MSIAAPLYGLFGFGQALYFASRGMGKLFFPVMVSVLRMLVIVLFGWIAITGSWEFFTVFVVAAVSLAIMGIGQALCLFTPGWQPDKSARNEKQVAIG